MDDVCQYTFEPGVGQTVYLNVPFMLFNVVTKVRVQMVERPIRRE